MKVIAESYRTHYIRYLHFFLDRNNIWLVLLWSWVNFISNCIDVIMVSVFALGEVDRGFKPRSDQTIDSILYLLLLR